ncbi:MAG: galactose oxidase-like domain-containing protein [Actinomycetota bacterium]
MHRNLYFAVMGTGLAIVVAIAVAVMPRSASADETYDRIVVGHSRLCLEARGRTHQAPSGIVQVQCSGVTAQRFGVSTVSPGYVRIGVYDEDMCLDFQPDATHRSTVRIAPCEDTPSQHFELQALGGGAVNILTRQNGLCLSMNGAADEVGALLVQDTCSGGEHQQLLLDGFSDVAGEVGLWSPVIEVPLIPVAAAALPNGKVLMWSAFDRYDFNDDYLYGFTETAIFDPATGRSEEKTVSNTGHDMFCPGIAHLADGRILVNGGSSAFDTSIYNPETDEWETGGAMNIPRGYQGTTLLADGRAFTLGGSFSGGFRGKDGEIWDEENGWQRLPGVSAEPFTGDDDFRAYRGDNHLWLFGWTDNRIFHAGPTSEMHWIDVEGEGRVTNAGIRGEDPFAMNGTAVMYEPGKILTTGGAPTYDWGQATANATIIDITGDEVTTKTLEPMAYRRGFHNSTVLPSGEVVITGGVPVTGVFEDFDSVLDTEIFDPETETFRVVAAHAVPRNYHSFSLLMPDGRVLIGGGGLCGDCETNHPDVEIFTPPYLLNADGTPADRPTITSAPDVIDLSEVFEVEAEGDVTEFVLVRMSSATHSVNNDQRRVPVESDDLGGGIHEVTAPADGGVAIPGLYYLFAMDDEGVPSEAAIVRVTMDQADGETDGL